MNLYGRPAYPIGFFATITIVIVALSTSILLWDARKRELAHTRMEAVGITKIFVEQTERSFESADLVLKGVQDRLNASFGIQFPLDSLEVHLLLGTRVLGMRQLDALFLIDTQGRMVNSSIDFPIKNVSVVNQEYFKVFLNKKDGGLFIGKPFKSPQKKEWMLYLARKIYDQDGRFKGVVVGSIDIAHFEDIYQILRLDNSRPVSLFRDDGVLIAGFPHRENLIGERAPELGETLPILDSGKVHFLSHKTSNGDKEELVLEAVPKFPLFIAVTNDVEEALASWRETAIPIILSSLLVSFFIIIAASLLIREAMRQLRLAAELGATQNRYQYTIDSLMDAIIAVDEEQNIILFNPSAERMFGYRAEEVMGKSLLMLLPARFQDAHHAHVRKFRNSETGSRAMGPQLGISGLRSDGTEFPIESTISQALSDGKKQLTAVL